MAARSMSPCAVAAIRLVIFRVSVFRVPVSYFEYQFRVSDFGCKRHQWSGVGTRSPLSLSHPPPCAVAAIRLPSHFGYQYFGNQINRN